MKKRLLFIAFLFIGLSTIILIRLNTTIFLDEQKAVYDNVNKILNAAMNGIKQDVLSFSLAATSFPSLKEAIALKNEKVIIEILNELNDNLNKSFKDDKIQMQILTQEHLYCTTTKKGTPLNNNESNFNDLLNELKGNKNSIKQTNDGIKITTPIIENGAIIAFFDINIMYEVLVQTMRNQKVEIIVLLEDKNKVVNLNEKRIGVNKEYVVFNDNYNKTLLDSLILLFAKEIEELFTKEYLYKNDLFYALYDMKNSKAKSLGKFVAVLNQQAFSEINNKESFFLKNIVTINNSSEDFYNFVKHKEENMFLNIEKGYIKNLKDVVDQRDKLEFEEIARQKLLNLSKEELVDFILQQSKHSEIKGQIR